MCWMCSASSQPDIPWTDFSWGAAWRHTLWTHDSYMRHLTTIGAPIPVLFSVIGLRLSSVMIDVLHTCDLGITCHILANVFWLMAVVRSVFGGANIKAKIANLNDHLKKWYQDHKTEATSRISGKLTPDRVRPKSGWPKLRAKGAVARHLLLYALAFMREFGDGTTHDNMVTAIVELLSSFMVC